MAVELTMSAKVIYQPDHAFPPGETLLETLETLEMTLEELAARMGYPLETIYQIVKGTARIMQETAIQLENSTGVPASF